ncbi:type II toxin-antitoxin system RelE/ParE family toxin [Rhizobium sp. XQZ8]|uniref:type II toxin-antitoxin system RelE/ParE family toxin n=1 Tax=Rhizobium populisoli TaxID=2859785 RepID=UPI001C677119|nr:type II toxin-antitoxin system RelE/ParE family toxin [Rhizobium populisoli]MBW6421735.1 type II toxin-antitoxin system RelE/ParE family toxin [Rhizobium populisoli]
MPEFRLTRRADKDMLDIFVFGLEAFGHPQARKYATELQACFMLLAKNPRMGRVAAALGSEVRRHEHQSHVILYEIAEYGILILGIVHKRNARRLTPH